MAGNQKKTDAGFNRGLDSAFGLTTLRAVTNRARAAKAAKKTKSAASLKSLSKVGRKKVPKKAGGKRLLFGRTSPALQRKRAAAAEAEARRKAAKQKSVRNVR